MTVSNIFTWIFENFKYYRNLALLAFWVRSVRQRAWPSNERTVGKDATDFRTKYYEVFWEYEVPLLDEEKSAGVQEYVVSKTDGLGLLDEVLGEPKYNKAFPIFELPAKLRDSIYELVLQYPKSGIYVLRSGSWSERRSRRRPRQLALLDRSDDEPFDFQAWTQRVKHSQRHDRPHEDNLLRSRLVKSILAPLLSSRQFYSKAMPVFYRINRFHFVNPEAMALALMSLARERRKHITHISFKYCVSDSTASAFRGLLSIDNLRRLDIHVEPEAFRKTPRMKKVPGLDEVTFSGDCEGLKGMVRDALLKSKEGPSRSGKRKGVVRANWRLQELVVMQKEARSREIPFSRSDGIGLRDKVTIFRIGEPRFLTTTCTI